MTDNQARPSNQNPEVRAAERAHDQHAQFVSRTQDAAVQTGQLYLRSVILINGGAAIAVLALLGTLIGQQKITPAQLHAVAYSLLWFAFGVAASAISLGLGYLTNYSTQALGTSRKPVWEHPYFQPGETTPLWQRRTDIFTGLSIAAGILAIAFFIIGIFVVYDAITKVRF